MVEALLANIDQNKIDLAIATVDLAKESAPQAIELIKGHFLKKRTKIRLVANAVFTLYGAISIEDYNSIFTKKVTENKISKNTLKINDLQVRYSIKPNIKTQFPAILSAEFGNAIIEKEIVPIFTKIDQVRLFIYPSQEQMYFEDLENFIRAFDSFLSQIESGLRLEKKIPLNLIVKHIIFESDDQEFLRHCTGLIADDSLRIYCSKTKISITYSKLEKLLDITRILVS